MDQKTAIRLSKFLSYVLRHAPDEAGLVLAEGGWVGVDDLLAGAARAGNRLSRAELEHLVASSDKQRFAFDESRTRIRANQGHSVPVDLQLEPRVPPAILYHGTADRFLDSILASGISKQSRHHVHLSASVEQAVVVGKRHGRPVVLAVDAEAAHAAGVVFYMADNGVWLADEVPAQYLARIEGKR